MCVKKEQAVTVGSMLIFDATITTVTLVTQYDTQYNDTRQLCSSTTVIELHYFTAQ